MDDMAIIRRALSGFPHLRSTAKAVTTAVLVGVALAGCAVDVPGSSSAAPRADMSKNPAVAGAGQRIVLTFEGEVVPATLADTAAARQFAALLPVTLDLRDPMGQAKSGRLPAPIDDSGAETVTDPTEGGIYYAPDSRSLAIFYDDLGQSVPPPGLVRLGTVDGGVEAISAARNRIRLRIYPADRTSP